MCVRYNQFFFFLGIFRNYLFLKHLTKLYTNDRLYDWNNAILSKRKIKNSKKDKTQWRREKKNKTKKSMKNSKSSVKWGGLIRKSHAESNMQRKQQCRNFRLIWWALSADWRRITIFAWTGKALNSPNLASIKFQLEDQIQKSNNSEKLIKKCST